MTDIISQAICDSYAERSPRLLTMFTRSPTFNHQETLRHRKIYIEDNLGLDPDFSFSVSSSRAIPFIKRLEEASNPKLLASPIHWGAEQKGMSPTEEELDDTIPCINWKDITGQLYGQYSPIPDMITKRECAKRLWGEGAIQATKIAKIISEVTGVHKTIPNRMVAPYVHTNALLTATEPGWMNFFGLRLDKAADPTLRALAEACWKVWNESQPKKLIPREWHLPYIQDQDVEQFASDADQQDCPDLDTCIKISVARCARLSYLSFDTQKRSTIEEDLKLYNRLVGSYPIHASPAEHIATPDKLIATHAHAFNNSPFWQNPHLSGNLGPGWQQYRKLLPNEAIAPLPQEYQI